jgi:hypothetical protein
VHRRIVERGRPPGGIEAVAAEVVAAAEAVPGIAECRAAA